MRVGDISRCLHRYNLGWPLAVGQDWLAAMEETHRLTNTHTAIECSFMAPGLGPWRPDMAPYVDEHGPDVVKLGLEWHPKMLFRTLLSGLIINPYHTPLAWISNEYNISYWLGGLITTGVAPQIDDQSTVWSNSSKQPYGRWVKWRQSCGVDRGGSGTLCFCVMPRLLACHYLRSDAHTRTHAHAHEPACAGGMVW